MAAEYMTISEFAIEYEDAYYAMMQEDVSNGKSHWSMFYDRYGNIIANRFIRDPEANAVKYELFYIAIKDKVLKEIFDSGKYRIEAAEYYLHEPKYKPLVTVYII